MLLWRLVTWLNYFTWKTMSFAYINEQKQQKISKEVKRQGLKKLKKRLKAIRKNHIDKNKEKRVFYMELVHFTQCRAYIRPFMHALVFPLFLAFLSLFSLVLPFSEKVSSCIHALEYGIHWCNYFHILRNLVVYIYMYKWVYTFC